MREVQTTAPTQKLRFVFVNPRFEQRFRLLAVKHLWQAVVNVTDAVGSDVNNRTLRLCFAVVATGIDECVKVRGCVCVRI
jgi:hypothetical protein